VVVSVNAAPVINQSPIASAGQDQTITLPTSMATLNGSGSDADGSIASYAWSKVSGPSQGNIASPSSASTSVTGLAEGSYTFRLTVRDNDGATAFDDVVVSVNAAPTSSLKIEAESYISMNGIQTENTQDAEGGLNVTSIDNNDWMEYSIDIAYSGTYTVNFRIATTKGGTKFQLREADGTVLTTINAPNTGGVQKWQTISATITLSKGQQTLRIFTNKVAGNLNINWWELILNNATTARSMSGGMTGEQVPEISSTFKVYPTPAKEQLTLELNNPYKGQMKIQILNMNGTVVKEFIAVKETNKSQITFLINELPKGEYIVLVQIKNEKRAKKVVKM
jgi:hypothetical protein